MLSGTLKSKATQSWPRCMLRAGVLLAVLHLSSPALAEEPQKLLFCGTDEQTEYRHGTPLALTFSGFTSQKADSDVDTDPQRFRLVNGQSCSQQGEGSLAHPVIVDMPSGCTIGNAPVRDEDIVFVINGQEQKQLILASRTTTTLVLRFKAAGRYGRLPGAITCRNSGAFAVSF